MKTKNSSPSTDELGKIDFVPTDKSKANINIGDEPEDVKDGVESLFTILGQALCISLSGLARLQRGARVVSDG
ncbi:unnamed protein product [marine sediment metagenome]|uniref:Uncharacterized protein n=1 Tax=marine sediment metagenome TaxID=412755 RepID=X1DHP4_9ZZZZ